MCLCSGTPTSTTTSLSALSTTAIKDGQRGHALPTTSHRGHHQHASLGSLEAERADRISRLAGLSSVSQQLRSPPDAGSQPPANNSNSPQTTPTSTTFPPQPSQAVAPQVLGVPAYFDSNGQPTAVTKMSTVGTASATESVSPPFGLRATVILLMMESTSQDIDMLSTDTNFGRETEVDSVSGYVAAGHHTDMDADEDMTSRSVGHFEQDENMSDDGSASLVGFGEGANSTISGPIYVRRPLPGVERTGSGLSEGAMIAAHRQRYDREDAAAAAERREARIIDGVSSDGPTRGFVAADEDAYVDTTTSGPVPVAGPIQPGYTSSLRETQHGPQTRHHWNHQQPPTAREAAERAMRERGVDAGSRSGTSPLASPGKKLTFEDQK